ncbi:MAG: small ribosomal subunit Rsm22 family protein [Bdellovibrionota bacterium]
MKLAEIIPHLLYTFPHESDLIRAIEEISRKFTTERAKIGDYLKDERLVSAYTAFYLATNVPKLSAIMKWMPEEWKESLKGRPLIDLGAGPGTFSLAWREIFGAGEFLQIENSEAMRKQARKLWDGNFPAEELKQSGTVSNGVLLFGHSANEMRPAEVIHYVEKFSPDDIIFIEPGTPEFFGKMLEIRSELISNGWNVLYPCPGEAECPMKGTTDWCHQFIHVSHDQDVERLSQIMRLDRKLLPLTVQIFSRRKYSRPEERLVRVMPETKFSFEWQVCHNNVMEDYQVMKRGMDKATEKKTGNLLSGEGLVTELDKDVSGKKRVKLR